MVLRIRCIELVRYWWWVKWQWDLLCLQLLHQSDRSISWYCYCLPMHNKSKKIFLLLSYLLLSFQRWGFTPQRGCDLRWDEKAMLKRLGGRDGKRNSNSTLDTDINVVTKIKNCHWLTLWRDPKFPSSTKCKSKVKFTLLASLTSKSMQKPFFEN